MRDGCTIKCRRVIIVHATFINKRDTIIKRATDNRSLCGRVSRRKVLV